MTRSRARIAQDRADLLAALTDAAERPVTVPTLVAAAYGYTLDTIPDLVLHAAMHRAGTDLRALYRAGDLVMDTPYIATYTRVDLPGSDLAEHAAARRHAREDEDDLRRQMAGWEPADT